MKIVAWPPVGIVGIAPTVERPVVRSHGLFSGQRVVSSAGPARRLVSLNVSALARNRAGAGYMEQLWREIDGGMHLVWLSLGSSNWHLDAVAGRDTGHTAPLRWQAGDDPLAWQNGGHPLTWYSGAIRLGSVGTCAQGYATITLAGLPPSLIVARPDDVIRSWVTAEISHAARAVTIARSDASGQATIRLDNALPAGVISLHDSESVVFEVTNVPRAMQTPSSDWSVLVELREVLPFERVGATEHDPW